ncbi:YheC/YheD family protein [Alteribacter aurantiacus]|uniref:YheC/YheD family endospore coat-associated protein n=1 Tax=Alteribacter aurantiacus TaxID=254410 RepID=UPI0004282B72|nr:YheC/YheD family protein [Alteribacter aurantiacus]
MRSYWIQIVPMNQPGMQMIVPKRLQKRKRKIKRVHHGLLSTHVSVRRRKIRKGEDGSKKNPFAVHMSNELLSYLYVQSSLLYQLVVTKKHVKLGPVTGILVTDMKNVINDLRKESQSVVGGIFVALKPNQIDWESTTVNGFVFDGEDNRWTDVKVPLPEVLFVRTPPLKRIRKLLTRFHQQGGTAFNTKRYSKLKVEKRLRTESFVKGRLITSRRVRTAEDVVETLENEQAIVLKPTRGLKGQGLVFINRHKGDMFLVYDYRKRKTGLKMELEKSALELFLQGVRYKRKKYILQPWIAFLQYKGNPFDMRVHMQKNHGAWICSGIECRVAAQGEKLTNLSKGGGVVTFETAIRDTCSNVTREHVVDFALSLCDAVERAFPHDHFGDLGLDIGIDQSGKLYFIEVNFAPGYKGFKGIDPIAYEKISHQPFVYAAQLKGFDREEERR